MALANQPAGAPRAPLKARVVPDAPGGPIAVYESADVDADLNAAIASGAPTPYGRVLWDMAPRVAHVVSAMELAGKRVLELGCGTGLVALVAARFGARVLATDVDDAVLDAVARAARDAAVAVDTALFDVRSRAPLPAADIVVAADVLYEAPLAASIARRVLEAKARGSVVVLGDPGRVFRDQLARILADAGVDAAFSADGVVVI